MYGKILVVGQISEELNLNKIIGSYIGFYDLVKLWTSLD
jgi:hypothetical protein